jgi:hypothetical protein
MTTERWKIGASGRILAVEEGEPLIATVHQRGPNYEWLPTAEIIVQAPQMLELLRQYRKDHDADSCSPNGAPEPCGCSLCRKLDAILSRIGSEDGEKIEGKGRENAIRSE